MQSKLGLEKAEIEMFQEISAVFAKHKNVKRKFSLCLDHVHFEIKNGEVLLETNNPEKRKLFVSPVSFENVTEESFPTIWKVSIEGDIEVFQVCCADAPDDPSYPDEGPS